MQKRYLALSELDIGSTARIHEINCSENIKRRLLDLGLVQDTPIIPLFKSPCSDPIAYNIRNTVIAIRGQDANLITVYI